ncbi:OPT family oligopeptide transporter [Sporolactobacillus sp. THM7-7]|nr:OPT family oligopeptide transporter [Sporolactobacillus sp. THM7-7]
MEKKIHPKALEPLAILFTVATAVVGAIIGMQLIVTLGISTNTSIIGALLAVIIARIPLRIFNKFRSVHRQNLVQTSISSATFGAANSLMIPIGIPFILGETDLILPMLIGAVAAMFVDATVLYRIFDSKIFPASGTWPPGVATAESIIATDRGGKRAGFLGVGVAGGIIGSFFGIPMSAFGIAFIGNIWALSMFGLGLLFRGYSNSWFGIDLSQSYLPHGFMIGAGMVALIQVIMIIFKKNKTENSAINAASSKSSLTNETRSEKDMSRALGYGFLTYLVIALIIAVMGGLITKMSPGMFILYLLFAALAAFVHEFIVGIAAMHSGWFPAFAVALITLMIGMLIGFPPTALALLVGFSAATGPAFADMGYDLKTGYILRGNGSDRVFEIDGRRQQYITAIIAFVVTTLVVILAYNHYFAQNLVAPVDKVYVASIKAGVSEDIGLQLLLWAIPGALLQLIGGPDRQLGVLFSTGLLILFPMAGWAVIIGILIRAIILKVKGKEAETPMTIMAAGFIAGDALYSFFSSMFKMKG